MNIHVLIPSFNCGKWINRCLKSVASQKTQPVNVLVIDDASDDDTSAEIAFDACQKYNYSFLMNSVNKKCPYNIWMGVQVLDPYPDDVIFLLDGDDFLPHGSVFDRYAQVYADENVWMTYGNYSPHPTSTGQTPASAYPERVIRDRSFRTAGNLFNHPITFRRFLFDALKPSDMQNDRGKWFRGGYDFAIIVPMLEMAGGDHFLFLDEDLYKYNAINPISDSRVNRDLIQETEQLIRRSKKDLLVR